MYRFKMFIISIAPVIAIHLLLLPLWIISTKNNATTFTTSLTSIETIIDILIVPLYLLVCNFILCIRYKQRLFIFNLAVILFSSFIGNLLHYVNWGVSVNMLFHPDSEAVLLFYYFVLISSIIIIIIGIILQLILLRKFKTQ